MHIRLEPLKDHSFFTIQSWRRKVVSDYLQIIRYRSIGLVNSIKLFRFFSVSLVDLLYANLHLVSEYEH